MQSVKIGVFPAEEFSRRRRLLQALGELFSLEFEPGREGDATNDRAALLFGVTREAAIRIAGSGLRCLAFLKAEAVVKKSATGSVCLASIPYLAPCFRGRTLPDSTIGLVSPLQPEAGDEVVARKGEDALWIHRPEQNSAVDLVATECPNLSDTDYLFQHFQRDDWARLLPLLHFLREVSAWEPPPLRACFMIDDPNLHWKSYGYIRYDQLVQHASAHSYHVSFATVPLDAWYVHPPTAALFREHQSRLSLLVHGNNHTRTELAQSYGDQHRQALMAQALNRIGQLEERSGLEVPRVMAAPHGACTEEMAQALLQTGFEAACIGRGSLMKFNQNKAWPVTIGLNVAEFLGDGFPVISRHRLSMSESAEVDFCLAAFLGKPVIPNGHHEDLAHGLDLFRDIANLINSMGQALWMDMKAIARSNFCTCRKDEVLHVRMYSRVAQLRIPEGVQCLCIQRAWINGEGHEGLKWRNRPMAFKTMSAYQGEPISAKPGDEMEIVSICSNSVDPRTLPGPSTSLRAVTRRCLCEVRDRLKPALDRWRTFHL